MASSSPTSPFALSAAQRGIWFAQHLAGDTPISIAQYVEFDGAVDIELLADAARQAGREFGTGYLRLLEIDELPWQLVDTSLDDRIDTVDFRDEADPAAAARAWMRAEYTAPLDMTRDRLCKVAMLRLAEDRWWWYSRFHHILLDGVGALTMLQRTGEIYNAAARGEQIPEGKAQPLQHIVEADAAYRDSDKLAADRQYWREHLTGMAEPAFLGRRTGAVDAHPRLLSGALPDATATLLDAVAAELSTSAAPIVVAAFAAFVGAMTGSGEIVLSLPVSGRTTAHLRRSGGMVANVVPLRLHPMPTATVGMLIRATQNELTAALRRQRYRQEDIIRDLGWAMDEMAGFGPTVNLMLADTRIRLSGVTGRLHVLTSGLIDDLFVNVYPGTGGERTHIDFQANPNRYGDAELTGLHARFLDFLHRFLAAGLDGPLTGVAAVSERERAELVPAYGRTPAQPRTLPEILTAGAHHAPSAIAMRVDGSAYTYQELSEYCARLARVLIAAGAGPERPVAISIPRSAESVLATWAVAQTGAAFVPIDPGYPKDRIEHMVTDSGVVAGVTVAAARTALPDRVRWLVLDDPETERQLESASSAPITDADRSTPVHLDQLAYLIYTSGSTGLPKGVGVTHRGLANLASGSGAAFGVAADAVVAHAVSPSFDISVEELLIAFAVGATVAVVPPAAYAGDDLARVLRALEVTHLNVTPAVAGSLDPDTLPRLRTVVVGGDACPPELPVRWAGRTVLNGYGPTETTVTATLSAPLAPGDAITIGGPSRGARAVVLDPWLRPVPHGVTGELYLGGDGLARGYHQRIGFTAERFVANPFAAGERLYRTGDLVRWVRRKGQWELEFGGRSDTQVKVRGFRIELGEIDAAVARHPGVQVAITVGATTPGGATALVTYVLPGPAPTGDADVMRVSAAPVSPERAADSVEPSAAVTVDPEAVKATVAQQLPAHMVPAVVMVLDALPLTPAGKVDRRALPEPDFTTRATAGRAPVTEREQVLAGVFAAVLGVESVGADDNFFALGGDSIVAIQLVARAKSAGLGLRARDVFEHKTVAALAAVATDATAPQVHELPGGGIGPIPLTPVVHAMLEHGPTWRRYAQAALIPLPQEVDRDRLVPAVQALLDRHDVLRSKLVRASGTGDSSRRPRSESAEAGFDSDREWEWTVGAVGSVRAEDLVDVVRAGGDSDVEAELQWAADRLDPAGRVMARFVLIERGGAGPLLWVVLHHLVTDGITWRVLLPDLATAWAGGELQPVGTSFRRWAHGQLEQVELRRGETALWQRVLETPDPPLDTHAFDPRRDTVATMGQTRTVVDAEIASAALELVPERFHCGVDDALLTALAMAAARVRTTPRTLLTLEGHGREEALLPGADVSRTAGWFTSVYPVALDLTGIDLEDAFRGGAAAGAALKAVKEQLRAIPDKGVGYGMLRYLDADAGLGHAPVPQLSFNYLGRTGTGGEGVETPWLPARFTATNDDRAPLAAAVDINAFLTDAGLEVTWAYASRLFTEARVREFAALWAQALTALTTHARQVEAGGHTPSDFPLVAVRQSQIDDWEQAYPGLTDVWPLSPLQYGLLFHAKYDNDTADGYTVQTRLSLAGRVEAPRLRAAAQALLDRHEVLRVAFTETSDGPRQLVVDAAEIPWQEVDLSHIPEAAERQRELERLVAVDGGTRFDLARPPLLRFTLIRTGAETYTLLMTNHHLVLDGWSTPLVVRELLSGYLSAVTGHEIGGAPAHSYREFLAWLDEQDDAASIAAWREALAGVDAPTRAIPTLAGLTSTESGMVTVDFSTAHLTRLEAAVRAAGATVNTGVQAAWALLLTMLTGRTDVIFGGTVSGRPPQLTGVEEMVGLFINTLPVRVRLDPGERVAALLARVQGEQARLLDHQHVGLAAIHQAVGLPELFDTLTVFESYPIDRETLSRAMDIAGMRILDVSGTDATPYPLNLMVIPQRDADGAESLQITVKFMADQLPEAAARRLLERFVLLLDQIAEHPNRRVAQLQHCEPSERRSLLPVRGGEPMPMRTLPQILAAGASVNPDAIAISSGAHSMSYRDLDTWSNRFARLLLSRGVGREVFVVLALTRSVESVVAVWALAKTGAAFLPLDPNYPVERIEHILTDSQAPIGVTVCAVGESLPGTIDWLLLDDLNTIRRVMTVSDAPITDAERGGPIDLSQTAYLIYTSGSTGKPKAVLLSHRGIANLIAQQETALDLNETSSPLQVASPSFDASVHELLMAHAMGGRLVISPPDVYGGSELEALLREQRVTHAVITPSVLATMNPAGLTHLQNLAVAGEAAGPELVAAWSPGRRMVNLYGPTEFSIWATGPGELRPGEPITIGEPIRGAQAMVLDTWLRPVPVGITGELYLAGPALARGYFNRFALTAARFVTNPYGAPGTRMYRTGDMVRWVEAKSADETRLELEYQGRSDFQVKIRGLRIELGEIDAVLSADDQVEYAATLGCPGPGGQTVLVSYVVPVEGERLDTELLRTRVAGALPGYMVPSYIIELDDVPLTPVGKLDRNALTPPDFTSLQERYLAPRSAVETAVSKVFAEILGTDQVSIDRSFFELGGNSLSATRVVARVNAALGATIALRDLFDAPTVAQLSARITPAGELPFGGFIGRPALAPRIRPDRVPLSPAQQRMWVLNRMDPSSAAYNITAALRLTGALDLDALRLAIADVVARHETLRTIYPADTEGPRQIVVNAEAATPELLVVDTEDGAPLRDRIDELTGAGFDLTRESPLRVGLLRIVEAADAAAPDVSTADPDETLQPGYFLDADSAARAQVPPPPPGPGESPAAPQETPGGQVRPLTVTESSTVKLALSEADRAAATASFARTELERAGAPRSGRRTDPDETTAAPDRANAGRFGKSAPASAEHTAVPADAADFGRYRQHEQRPATPGTAATRRPTTTESAGPAAETSSRAASVPGDPARPGAGGATTDPVISAESGERGPSPTAVGADSRSDDVHVVVLVVHHISADGASMAPLAADLVGAYLARCAGAEDVRPELRVQYSDYSLWQRELLGDDRDPESVAAQQVRYWSERLAGTPDVLELPTDRPRPAVQSMRSADLAFGIESEMHGALGELAARTESSLFMVVHAALAVLLSRLAGTPDVLVGTAMSGRGEAALDDMVGMFVNTLALRTPVDPSLGFREFLAQVRTADLDAFANADVPFERLVQVLDPARSTAHHPLFQVSLSLQNFTAPVLEFPGLRVEVEPIVRDASQFDLTFDLREPAPGATTGLDGTLTYAVDLFDEATAALLLTRWRRVLDAITADPDIRISDIDLLDDSERAALVPRRGPRTTGTRTLAEVLQDAAATRPDHTAVIAAGRSLSYRRLDADSARLARHLTAAGAGPETVVALALSRGVELLTAIWATAKVGAAFVPVDPRYPLDRIEHMLSDSGALLGLTISAHREVLPDTVTWLVLDDRQSLTPAPALRAQQRESTDPEPRPMRPHPGAPRPGLRPSGSGARPPHFEPRAGQRGFRWAQPEPRSAPGGPRVPQSGPRPPQAAPRAQGGARPPQFFARTGQSAIRPGGSRLRPPTASADHPAWLIYTSGSTGMPKGVSVSHGGIADLVAAQRELLGLDENSRVLQVASPSFDASAFEALMAFGAGGTAVISPPDVFGGEALSDLIAAHQVTHLVITPSALATMDPAVVTSVRVLAVAGEAIGPELVEKWAPGRMLVNLYGPTEFTIWATASTPLRPGQPVTIGRPIRGAETLVLDDRLRPVPMGVAGELYLAGPALARGYHARPALTAGRFVTNPYGGPGARMYRTGDLVRWTGDLHLPTLEYLGRTDFQVKVRGQRIELGEIDAVLARAEGVEFAVTLGVSGPGGATALAAYLLPEGGRELDLTAIRAHAADSLPGYMVPSAFVVLDAVPLNAVGKLDRKALPEPVFEAETEYRAPSTATEKALAAIVAELLGRDRVGVHDSFFALGGDSILAIQLVSRARLHGLELSPLQVFEHRTVAALAALAEEAGEAIVLEELPGGGVGDIPLTPIVSWMLERGGDFGRFAQTAVLEMPRGITREQIVATVTAVVDRHDMLRARLRQQDGQWRLSTGEPGTVEVDKVLHRIEFSTASAVELREYAATELDSAFERLDPAEGVMLQLVWLDPVDPQHAGRLILVAHHLVIDGVSWRILVPDLIAAWAQLSGGADPVLAEPGTSVRRWAHALHEEARRPSRTAELEYWRAVAATADPAIGPRELDPGIDTAARVRAIDITVPEEVTTALLTTLPGLFDGTVEDALLAALALAVQRWRGSNGNEPDSVLIRMEGHGRQQEIVPGADLSRTIGWFTTVYPVRLDLPGIDLEAARTGGPGMGEVIRAVKHQLLDVPDKGIGYGLLRYLNDETGSQLPRRVPGRIGFNYLGRYAAADIPAGLEGLGWLPTDELGDLHAPESPDVPVTAEVEINAVVVGDRMQATFTYPGTLLGRGDVAALAWLWVETLTAAADFAASPAAQEAAAAEVRFMTDRARAAAEAELAAAQADSSPGLGLDVVLPIRLGGERPALFCIHPSSGIAWTYLGFAEQLAPGRPIYGLQAPDLSGDAHADSIEDFAERYAREIRRLQPEGPYHVLGWSFGGLIAHAVAVQLKEQGAEMGALVLLDADSTDIDGHSIEKLTAGSFVAAFGSVFGITDMPADATAQEAADLIRDRMGGVSLVDATTLERMAASYNASARTRTGYQRPVYHGDALYFSATVDRQEIFGPQGWHPWITGEITSHDIEATHEELTAPDALAAIAALLDEYLGGTQ
ncbi:non-ribosomal peptide synthetase [Nocardia inohanensis]|uniref:non-ribosomal peptide synthetase n=1 Tax=Nocardia inohanensis TaxID=209246 RepID=UPI00082AEB87|nr:non-ribosomal peptide synthetase [Nocardia inohanensis]